MKFESARFTNEGLADNTGKLNNNNTAVINILQLNKGNFNNVIPGARIFKAVAIKLIAPNKLLMDVKCNANIVKSIAEPLCDCIDVNG